MEWLNELVFGDGVAHSILLFAFVIAAGVFLGKFKIKGISLGVTFVLFVGIIAGHFGLKVNSDVLQFMKEFGLILFVYSIGLQVGPGFVASLRKGGVRLNILSACIVLLGVGITLLIYAFTDTPLQTMVGIMSGAVTNTPGLGAAEQAFQDTAGVVDNTIAMGYAVAYPLAVVGIIGSIIFIKYLFKIDMVKEEKKLTDGGESSNKPLELVSVEVENQQVIGENIEAVRDILKGREFIATRIYHKNSEKIEIATSKSILGKGDMVLLVTTPEDRKRVVAAIGREDDTTQEQWAMLDQQLTTKRLIVTKSKVNGQTLEELNLRANFGINITRVSRSGVELIATPKLHILMGDSLTVVGTAGAIESAERVLGNKATRLNDPHLLPIFVGIFLGVLLGSVPIAFPGIPQPVKLGLAGGPLVVAILMSLLGTRYRFVSYTTISANLMLREVGICFFLACVGLGAGDGFINTIVNEGGLYWVAYGFAITVVPLLLIGILARVAYKMNYYVIMGLLAGSMTDPPALAYANSISDNATPAISYAAVYPLTMFMRVLCAQLLILLFL